MAGGVLAVFWREWTGRQMRAAGAAILVSLAGAGFSAHAGLMAPRAVLPAGPRPTGYEAQDHFPGAALYFAADDATAADAAPTQGTTGTAPLPDMPVPDIAGADASIRPAPPFHLAGSALDRSRALTCLATAIYYEAAREPDASQRAVAQVILNRASHPAFPATVCGVVYQGSERRGCQFSFACDGSMARAPAAAYYNRALRVAADALNGSVFAPVGMATHYHTYAVTPSWNRGLVMTGVFGAHFFHRWKGWWGTPAAFRQRYAGGEPVPGPHARIDVALARAVPGAARAAPAPTPLASPTVQGARAARGAETALPQYVDSGRPNPDLPESQILDRWRHSGEPLR